MPTRRRERARHLLVLPTVNVIEADVHDSVVLRQLLRGTDAVINMVGVLHGGRGAPWGAQFAAAHVELPARLVEACRAVGVRRLLHVSALKAAPDAPSAYLRSKAAGEAAVIGARSHLAATIFRPSAVFGADDRFLNLFAQMQRVLPVVVLGSPGAKFQPVHVGDVAEACVRSLDREESYGRAYDLVGPGVYTLRELVRYAGVTAGCPRPIVGLGPRLSWLQALLLEYAPGRPLTRDIYRSMMVDSVADAALPFGLRAKALEAVAPAYLCGPRARSRYSALRDYARREARG